MPYYAVAIGRKIGIFRTWEEAKLQVNGFSKAKFKKFDFYEDAQNFISSNSQKLIPLNQDFELPNLNNVSTKIESYNYKFEKNPQMYYYAVARGTKIGIYSSWTEAKQYVENYRFPKYQKFLTENEAIEFIELYKIKKRNSLTKENYKEHNNLFDIYSNRSNPNNGNLNSEGGINLNLNNVSTKVESYNYEFEKNPQMYYYAVARGTKIGIYSSWNEAKQYVENYRSPKYQKFLTENEAIEFIELYKIKKSNSLTKVNDKEHNNLFDIYSDSNYPTNGNLNSEGGINFKNVSTQTIESYNYEFEKSPQMYYYAVARGTKIGIYSSWTEAKQYVENYRFPKYKKFLTENEAIEFIELYKIKASNNLIKGNNIEHDNVVDIYCDGSVPNNGQLNSEGGIGIIFGNKEISEIVPKIYGSITNNISELYALLRVFEIIEIELQLNNNQFFRIFTDSQYSILSITEWSKTWKQNDWVNSLRQPVKNAQLIKIILDKYEKLKAYCELCHVKGHTNNDSPHSRGNNKADELARKASSLKLKNNSLKRKIELDDLDFDLKKIKFF